MVHQNHTLGLIDCTDYAIESMSIHFRDPHFRLASYLASLTLIFRKLIDEEPFHTRSGRSQVTPVWTHRYFAPAIIIAIALAGCAPLITNQPLLNYDSSRHSVPTHLSGGGRSDEIIFIVAFSGGGTRAAALSYGVLEALAEVNFRNPRSGKRQRLLDEIDIISSVSGGSFTAAYYGLFGDRIFEDYESVFLRQPVTRQLILRALLPHNLIRLLLPSYGKSDLAAARYDNLMFAGATLGDLARRDGPLIYIQATDINQGERFAFNNRFFSPICSDVASYRVADAVAASAAVPVLFSPVALRNHAGNCEYEEPDWIANALTTRNTMSRQYYYAKSRHDYQDKETHPNVFLVDGGIADNLGIRFVLEMAASEGGMGNVLNRLGLSDRTQHIAFLIVNAQTPRANHWAQKAPGLGQLISAVTSTQINRYNFETVDYLRRSLGTWSEELRKDNPHAAVPQFHAIEVTFDAIEDPERRSYFSSIPTSLSLDDNQVDTLRSVAKELLVQSDSFQALLTDLNADWSEHR